MAGLDAHRGVAGHAEVEDFRVCDACVGVARAVQNDARCQRDVVVGRGLQGGRDGDGVAAEYHVARGHIDFYGGSTAVDHDLASAGLDRFIEGQHHGFAAESRRVVIGCAAAQSGGHSINSDAFGASIAHVASQIGGHGSDGGCATDRQFGAAESGGPFALIVGLDGFGGTAANRDRHAGVGFCCAADGDACGFLCGIHFVVSSNQIDSGLSGYCVNS